MNKLTRNSWIVTAGILILGFLLLYFQLIEYGITFFLVFPFSLGFAVGTHERKHHPVYTLTLGLLLFFGFLLAGQLEGFICVIMAFPIFLIMMLVGYKVQQSVLKKKEAKEAQKMMILFSPIFYWCCSIQWSKCWCPNPI